MSESEETTIPEKDISAIEAEIAKMDEAERNKLISKFSKEKDDMKSKVRYNLEVIDTLPASFAPDTIYLADFKKLYDSVCSRNKSKPTSWLVFGKTSKHASEKILEWDNGHLLVEDLNYKCELTEVAADVVPATSFAYMSCDWLSKK